MNADIKKLWLEALRSGEYKQGKSALHQKYRGEDRYCCLGLLCEIAAQKGIVTKVIDVDDGRASYDGEALFLPQRVVEWAELLTSSGDPTVEYKDHFEHLSTLNDDGKRFTTIASLIEKSL